MKIDKPGKSPRVLGTVHFYGIGSLVEFGDRGMPKLKLLRGGGGEGGRGDAQKYQRKRGEGQTKLKFKM